MMHNRIIMWFFFLLTFIFQVSAQNQLVFTVNFDDCSADELINGKNGTIIGSPECDCGVVSNGFRLEGNADAVDFPDDLNLILESDFTLSFYIKIENTQDLPVDILSHRNSCERDSSFAIRYIPITGNLTVEFAESVSRIQEIGAFLENPACWNFIAISKTQNRARLFINGKLKDEDLLEIPVVFRNGNPLRISNSPCIGFTDQKLIGNIDEIEIRPVFMNEREIRNLYAFPDRIISNDTTIIQGNSVHILTGGTCATDFTWTPEEGLSNQFDTNPVASPTGSVRYVWSINDGNCMVKDSILINVLSEGDVDCGDLLLPNAFTPNNDGVNDGYGISNQFLIDELKNFQIFDRWGAQMFSTTQKNHQWDGSFKGSFVNPGTFLYKVRYTCGQESYFKSGSFVLIR